MSATNCELKTTTKLFRNNGEPLDAAMLSNKISETDKNGIKAILYLQKLAGIEETEISANTIWQRLNPFQKELTLLAYLRFKVMEN